MNLPESDPSVQTVYLATYKKFMEAIDGIDNGEMSALTLTLCCQSQQNMRNALIRSDSVYTQQS